MQDLCVATLQRLIGSLGAADTGLHHTLWPSLPAAAHIVETAGRTVMLPGLDHALALIVIEGPQLELRFAVDINTIKQVAGGGVATLPPGMPIGATTVPGTRILLVAAAPQLIRQGVALLARPQGARNFGPKTKQSGFLADAGRLLARQLAEYDATRVSCRSAMLLAILENLACEPELSIAQPDDVSPYNDARIARVIELIDGNIADALSLDWLAKQAGISPYHLSRLFRRVTGAGLQHFVRERRVALACRQLAETRDSLAQIALDCGFSSQSHMTTAFRLATGLTPLAFRKACRQHHGGNRSKSCEAPEAPF